MLVGPIRKWMVTVIETAGYENDGQPKTVGGDA